jgi:hypothetical protein
VTVQGVVLDSEGLVISQATNLQYSPAVGSDRANFFVAWGDSRNGNNADVYGARVSPDGAVLDTAGIAVSQATGNQNHPAVCFDDANFIVVWADSRSGNDCDIYGARVTPSGVVFDSGPVVRQEGSQTVPALARGAGNSIFLAYQGWTGTVGGKNYSTCRIWGKMNPNPGVAEGEQPTAHNSRLTASIVRSELFVSEATSRKQQAASLLDISGRKVMDLRPGANDVRALAPGVYFVREDQAQAQAVRKIVLTE